MKKAHAFLAQRITAYYLLAGGLWILLSDRLLLWLTGNNTEPVLWQTIKGWFFVLVTGALLYALLSRAFQLRIKREQMLTEAHNQLSALIEASPLAIITLDKEGRVMSWNPAAENTFGWSENDVLGRANPIIPEDNAKAFQNLQQQVILGKKVHGAEMTARKKDETQITVSLSTAPVKNDKGDVRCFVMLASDITEQKQKEEQLRFLSLYDALTGIYNRTYFEQEMKRLDSSRTAKVGMIICDVDGLKLYNDSLGHQVGDRLLVAAARIIKNCFRESDVVARIGGDEFAVLLPDTDYEAVEAACARIRDGIVEYHNTEEEYYLSLSIGFAVSDGPVAELFKQADNNMYREKLRRNESVRNATIHILMKALTNRDFIQDGHTDRMEEMVANLAQEVGVPQSTIPKMRLFARFHDIGKVGISESILQKSEPLSETEISEIKRHAEIGHRIALSAPELAQVADWILKHHEWWNGQGYPLGLKGKDIPLECRILAIADAFDALTTARPYRSPIGTEEAFDELLKCSGNQFDPLLVEAFVEMMRNGSQQTIQELPV